MRRFQTHLYSETTTTGLFSCFSFIFLWVAAAQAIRRFFAALGHAYLALFSALCVVLHSMYQGACLLAEPMAILTHKLLKF